jgi:hypothetical protein
MSGQGSFGKELLAAAESLFGNRDGSGVQAGFLDGIINDVVRYARLRGM